ncbi:MAG: putative dehydrogenase like protein [Gammaproteobacteria bacterium]|jgi:NAD(P)-dependent dehydrogenase (short-subunit alcohol dehydrogenase family)|nr:putative dehydrogenase like protein [Gammaproteobacteria bacterium]
MKNLLIITGASRGIGAAIAEYFLNQQWQVINLSRSTSPNAQVQSIEVDFSDLTLLEEKLSALKEQLQQADKICLVHNAARLTSDTIQDIPTSSFEETLTVNLLAPNLLNQKIIPHMKKGSSIVYIGSTVSEMAVPNIASYVISKHALVGMMRATCQDLHAKEIHTACICPGFTDTEMLRQYIGDDRAKRATLEKRNIGQRLIHPTEIASVAWFCANNPVINGTVIHANLGQTQE